VVLRVIMRNYAMRIFVLTATNNFFFNNGVPKILFQEATLGNNNDIFNEVKTTIRKQSAVVLHWLEMTTRLIFALLINYA
jgi:hypothetical protein